MRQLIETTVTIQERVLIYFQSFVIQGHFDRKNVRCSYILISCRYTNSTRKAYPHEKQDKHVYITL